MAINMEKPRILVKTKNLQLLFDYCIESKTEFTVIPKNTNDTWEIELSIKSIIDAIKWGMYLKANKIDLIDNPFQETTISSTIAPKNIINVAKAKTVKKVAKAESIANPIFNETIEKIEDNNKLINNETEKTEDISLLSFDENKNQQNELF